MKLSTRSRYGTRLMIRLGLHDGSDPVMLKDIAEGEDISEKYLSQIIIPLKASGLVRSFRGAHGGYILAKAPLQISVGDIVTAIEGNIDLVGETKSARGSSKGSVSVTKKLWDEVSDKIAETLNSVTLEDLINKCRREKDSALMYNI
ncbi:MAG: RrF2 family transcriptional regulator [Candidatus Omnitrophica bacterium]|nr:RrF2 family transcriptional regulator [Candidatus Omnitrophota bacterium]